ncbi:hypothetical protein BLAT2472_50444 [Burkholderia latens]
MPAVRIYHRDRHRQRLQAGQHFLEPAVAQVRQHHEQRRLNQPETFEPAGHVRIGVVDRHDRVHLDLDFLAVGQERPVDRAARAAREIVHRLVIAQFLDRVRFAILLQIRGRGDRHALEQADAARDERRILQRPDADHAVDAFLQQIDRPVRQAELQIDVRVARMEFTQRRNHEEPADRPRHVYTQLSVRLPVVGLEACFGFLDVGEDPHASFVVRCAVRRERQPARRPVHQPHAEECFEILDDRRDGCPRQAERFCCLGEAACIDDASKHLHGLKPVHHNLRNLMSPRTKRLRYLMGKRSLGLFGGVELCCRIIGIYPDVCRTQNSFHLEMDAASSWTLLNSANS